MTDTQQWVAMGYIKGVFGVKGWLKIAANTEYADSLLANTEDVLNETLNKLGTNMTEALNLMQISLEDTIKTIQNSRKELK